MLIRQNLAMRKLLEDMGIVEYVKNARLLPKLATEVESKISQVDGCYFLGREPLAFRVEKALEDDDRTGVESSWNEVFIPDRSDEGVKLTAQETLAQGYMFMMRLADRLKEIGHFKVTLGFQNDEYTNCSGRFYAPPW